MFLFLKFYMIPIPYKVVENDIMSDKGKKLGTFYVDHSEGTMLSDPDAQHH